MTYFITGKLATAPQLTSEKMVSQSFCFHHWSITDRTRNKLSKIDIIQCLL